MKQFILKPEEQHLYDKYAGQAMNSLSGITKSNIEFTGRTIAERVAEASFNIAEAMILERRKRKHQATDLTMEYPVNL